MSPSPIFTIAFAANLLLFSQGTAGTSGRNVIIFVADGLRRGSVNALDSPTLLSVRNKGVDFENSHSLFPTFTTTNAAAIATGHYPGDTGDFSNFIFPGYVVLQGTPNKETPTPFLESDQVLADLDKHCPNNNYLNEESLLASARQAGYNTAAVGKLGPTLIQDVTQGNHSMGENVPPDTIIIDDSTGHEDGIPLNSLVTSALKKAHLSERAPSRSNGFGACSQKNNGFSGDNTTAGTLVPNLSQQEFFVDATTEVILPIFEGAGKPFILVFWSRDPDGTQHFQGDSLNSLTPGINGPTAKAAVRNADNDLKQILGFIQSHPKLADNTDIFITSDHGFATISKQPLEATESHVTQSYAAQFAYKDLDDRDEVKKGVLPPGFLAIDIAHCLGLPLFDPDQQISNNGVKQYMPVDPTIDRMTRTKSQRPSKGNGFIGGSGRVMPNSDEKVVVAANGGSDLIYVINKDAAVVRKIVSFLTKQDYVSGIFVDDAVQPTPEGALRLGVIGLNGTSLTPTPTIVVNFRSFATNSSDPLNSQVTICDTPLQQGQGMHGSFGRGDTFNNMAAIGPDFKPNFVDHSPVSNADIPVTLARILGFKIPSKGIHRGRVVKEALKDEPELEYRNSIIESEPALNGVRTILNVQRADELYYYDAAGFPGRTVGLRTAVVDQ